MYAHICQIEDIKGSCVKWEKIEERTGIASDRNDVKEVLTFFISEQTKV